MGWAWGRRQGTKEVYTYIVENERKQKREETEKNISESVVVPRLQGGGIRERVLVLEVRIPYLYTVCGPRSSIPAQAATLRRPNPCGLFYRLPIGRATRRWLGSSKLHRSYVIRNSSVNIFRLIRAIAWQHHRREKNLKKEGYWEVYGGRGMS